MEVAMYRGPVYFQALRHHVLDKIQMRHFGAINAKSHAPSGSSKTSGVRFGEMERDNALSHGGTAFLRERLVSAATGFETTYCRNCGWLAIVNAFLGIAKCKKCKNDAKFGRVNVPYTYIRLSHYINGLGLSMNLKVVTKEENAEIKRRRNQAVHDSVFDDEDIELLDNKEEEEEEDDYAIPDAQIEF